MKENGKEKVTYNRLAPKHYKISLHGSEYDVRVVGSGHMQGNLKPLFLEIDGRLEEVMIEVKEYEEVVEEHVTSTSAATVEVTKRPKAVHDGDVTTPIPGKIVEVLVKMGDKVKIGQPLLIVEAMKMDNELHAPKDGVIKQIYVTQGDSVMPDEALIFIE
jgi:pyruvate carboxylase subunit B